MTRKLSVLCAAIALVATVPAHAQSKGQFQIGVGAGLPFYNADLDLQDKVGFGGRLGYMFTDKIGLEGDVFYYETQPNGNSYTGPNLREMPIHGRLTYNAPMGKGLGHHLRPRLRLQHVGQSPARPTLTRPTAARAA